MIPGQKDMWCVFSIERLSSPGFRGLGLVLYSPCTEGNLSISSSFYYIFMNKSSELDIQSGFWLGFYWNLKPLQGLGFYGLMNYVSN